MIEITIIDNETKIQTNDLNICIEGNFELKKEGAEAPTLNVIGYTQKLSELCQEAPKNV